MVMEYKGRKLELPLSDENREFLVARSKDTLINQLDREWANIKAHQDAMEAKKAEADEAESESAEEDDEDTDYDSWTVQELTEEIKARNAEEGRETPISTTGKKDELVARIREDDAAG